MPTYTLLLLSSDADVDSGEQRYEATFSCGNGPVSVPVTREQFIGYVGMVGRTFSAGMKAVA